ncbi:MAG TPA: IclR family transcriptional regulator [Bauldia sp.]|nr:IclR family transcriptional regulator [Bauldia sp.]
MVAASNPDKEPASSSAVLTLVKALGVLEAVAASGGMTVAEIAKTVNLNRTTTHRLVQTLKQLNYLQTSSSGRGFEIGLKILPLAAQQLDSNKVRLAALPHLNTLAQQAGERVNLGVIFDGNLLYLAGVEKPSLPNMYSRFGKLAPVHSSSLGKAIIAQYPDEQLRKMLGPGPLARYTANTIVDPDVLIADLEETRNRGYAFDDQEHMSNEWCVAAPVFDSNGQPVASVGITATNRERALRMADKVMATAEVITHVLSPSRATVTGISPLARAAGP